MDGFAIIKKWRLRQLYFIHRGANSSSIINKIQPNQFHTVLLYNRGTEPQTILFYHTDEVQVPQVPRM